MKFEKLEELNYVKITTTIEGKPDEEVVLPQSFYVKAGINGHILIGSESQLYVYDAPELIIHFKQIEMEGVTTLLEGLLYLAKLFVGVATIGTK